MSDEKRLYWMIFLIVWALILLFVCLRIEDNNSKNIPTPTPEITNTAVQEPTDTPTAEITSTPTIESLPLPTGSGGEFKSHMDFNKIDDKKSKQYALQQLSYTDPLGLRKFKQYYLVALGQFYSNNITDTFSITFENGVTIEAMVGEVKRNSDTIDGMYCRKNGSIVEFIVDDTVLDKAVHDGGTVSSLGFEGKVISIIKIG